MGVASHPLVSYSMNPNQHIINRNKREYLDQTRKIHENVVAINIGNTPEHEDKKWEVAQKLMREGHTIVTEAILKNGYRPDILVISTEAPIAYEILNSEKDENLLIKSKNYKIKIIGVRV